MRRAASSLHGGNDGRGELVCGGFLLSSGCGPHDGSGEWLLSLQHFSGRIPGQTFSSIAVPPAMCMPTLLSSCTRKQISVEVSGPRQIRGHCIASAPRSLSYLRFQVTGIFQIPEQGCVKLCQCLMKKYHKQSLSKGLPCIGPTRPGATSRHSQDCVSRMRRACVEILVDSNEGRNAYSAAKLGALCLELMPDAYLVSGSFGKLWHRGSPAVGAIGTAEAHYPCMSRHGSIVLAVGVGGQEMPPRPALK
eukprot:scaffold82545_cov20-Tisochrysis_lutea.AAC.1